MIDDLQPEDVVVLACPQSDRICPWGELLSTAARARGAAGCVTDGLVRDIRFIREMGFPVFARGAVPLDSKGRGAMIKMDVPVECGGAAVKPGDWIFADLDGVVIIPSETLRESARGRHVQGCSRKCSPGGARGRRKHGKGIRKTWCALGDGVRGMDVRVEDDRRGVRSEGGRWEKLTHRRLVKRVVHLP